MGMCIRMYIDGEGLRLWPVREREGGLGGRTGTAWWVMAMVILSYTYMINVPTFMAVFLATMYLKLLHNYRESRVYPLNSMHIHT